MPSIKLKYCWQIKFRLSFLAKKSCAASKENLRWQRKFALSRKRHGSWCYHQVQRNIFYSSTIAIIVFPLQGLNWAKMRMVTKIFVSSSHLTYPKVSPRTVFLKAVTLQVCSLQRSHSTSTIQYSFHFHFYCKFPFLYVIFSSKHNFFSFSNNVHFCTIC